MIHVSCWCRCLWSDLKVVVRECHYSGAKVFWRQVRKSRKSLAENTCSMERKAAKRWWKSVQRTWSCSQWRVVESGVSVSQCSSLVWQRHSEIPGCLLRSGYWLCDAARAKTNRFSWIPRKYSQQIRECQAWHTHPLIHTPTSITFAGE